MNAHPPEERLNDYMDGALSATQRAALERHLASCPRCQAEVADLRALLESATRLPASIEPPRDLWREVVARLGEVSAAPSEPAAGPAAAWGLGGATVRRLGLSTPSTLWGVRPALAAALVLTIGAGLWLSQRVARPGWRVESVVGSPRLAAGTLALEASLKPGTWLQTDDSSRVRLAVGGIGEVNVEPNTRVRLMAARRTEHRLAMERGTIEARISAPPRLFYVETPSATLVDLGCAYTLEVDARGGSLIHVTVGWVELDRLGRKTVVPFNMSARTRRGFGPGTPFADRASDSLQAALYRFDFAHGGAQALAAVLGQAKEADAITLWHLLARTDGTDRVAVYEHLAALVPPPEGVTRDGVLRLERRILEKWWDALPGSPGTVPWWQRQLVKIGTLMGVL